MKSIIAKLYITIVSLIIILGLLFLLNEIWSSRENFKEEALIASDNIKEIIEENWYKYKNFNNENLKSTLENMGDSNIHSIIIYSHDKGIQLPMSKYNMRSFLLNNLIKNDPNWKDKPEYSLSQLENYVVSTPLQLTERGYSFDLIYNILSREKIQNILLDAIVVIVILFVLTLIVIIIFSIIKSKYVVNEYDDDSFKPMGGIEGEIDEDKDDSDLITKNDLDTLDDVDDFGFEDSTDDDFSLDDLSMDSEDQSFEDDFALEDTEDEFAIGSDDLDDFSLDTDESESVSELDDFDLDLEDTLEDEEPDEVHEEVDDFHMELDDSFDIEDETQDDLEEVDSLDDFDLELEDKEATETPDELESLDDFDLELDDNLEEATETPDDLESLDDFDLDQEEETEELEDLEDFDLGLEESDQETESLDDFDLGLEDKDSIEELDLEEVEDFDLDVEEPTQESDEEISESELDDIDLDALSAEANDIPEEDLEAFSLDVDDDLKLDDEDSVDVKVDEPAITPANEADEIGDLELDLEEDDLSLDMDDIEEISDDELSLDIEDESIDELEDDDLSLDIDDEPIDELEEEDLSLDIEDEELSLSIEDESIDELEDEELSLDIEDETIEDLAKEEKSALDALDDIEFDEEESPLDDLDDFTFDDSEPEDEEEVESGSEHSYNLSDFGVDNDNNEEGYSLEEFSIDSDMDIEDFQLDEEEFDLIDDVDSMDLSPEVIEASTDINDLPSMEIEEDLLASDTIRASKFKPENEMAPALSSLLEVAGVEENELSVIVVDISSDRYEGLNIIESEFQGNDNIFEMDNNLVTIVTDLNNGDAIRTANKLINSSKEDGINLKAGISSMSGRRVGENRLMGEAVMALRKADELSKDMLAFRPDPEKYKEYIKKNL